MQAGSGKQQIAALHPAEERLAARDQTLAKVIASVPARWPVVPSEDPIWGLIRIVMAQQVSTLVACRFAERLKVVYPHWSKPRSSAMPFPFTFRSVGLSQRRAECCVYIVNRSDEILASVEKGQSWEEVLEGIKGIGSWTVSVFRIMVLRDPDVLPLGDVGLERAIQNVYGRKRNVERLAENWRPFRSVACWYLWRTLGNVQLG